MNNPYLSAQKFAELCGTTKDTLRHYDEIGLLKPIMRSESRYRYYALAQVYTYDIIKTLTELGCPLNEIKERLTSSNKEQFLEYLKETDALIVARRKTLLKSMLLFENNIDFKASFYAKKITEPAVIEQAHNQFLLLTPLPKEFLQDTASASALCLQPHHHLCDSIGIYPFPIGHIISKNAFLQGNHTRTHLYSHIPDLHIANEYGYIKFAGKYVVIIHNGSYTTIGNTYDKLRSYIDKHRFHLKGDLYELNISHHIFEYQDEDAYFYISARVEDDES